MFSQVMTPKATGDAGVELDPLDPARGLVADVVVVAGLAPDHDAEAGDAGEAAGLGAELGGERQLEGAGNAKVWTEASLTPPSSKPSAAPFSSRSAMSS